MVDMTTNFKYYMCSIFSLLLANGAVQTSTTDDLKWNLIFFPMFDLVENESFETVYLTRTKILLNMFMTPESGQSG